LQKRFFDYYLKGIQNGWEKQPRVLVQVRRVDGFEERHETDWPLPSTQWTRVFLDAADRSLGFSAPEGAAELRYPAIGDGVTFRSKPLERETEITGPVALKLFLASSTANADVFATLRVFDPAGNEVDFQGALDPHTPIGQGWLRASHRRLDPDLTRPYRPYHTHDREEPLAPGEVYELDVEILPTSLVIPKGYTIALTLQGKDFEREGDAGHLGTVVNPMRGSGPFTHTLPADRPMDVFGGEHTVKTGGGNVSYLLLPVIPRG
jgi:hypothetical protein